MRWRKSRTIASAGVGALAVAMVAVAVAVAGYTFPSNVNFGPSTISPDKVTGVVKSTKGACRKGRQVKLYYEPPGRSRGGFEQIGSDRTNSDGKFRIDGSFFVGHYKVVVPAKSLGSNRQRGKLEDRLVEVEEDEQLDDEPLNRRGHRTGCSRTDSTSDE